MSWTETSEPVCTRLESTPVVDTIVEPRPRDIGGFQVRRVLPSVERRMVGPFVFSDEMGPGEFEAGRGLDVRPHPHVNLATVTYLFDGAILHRDSLGSEQTIEPGAINWMTAGRGIVHSERTGADVRRAGSKLHGIQLWIALPTAHEETEPEFHHHPASTIPSLSERGASLRLLAGTAWGERSPVRTFSPLFYVEAKLDPGAKLALPAEHEERGAYVVEGAVTIRDERFEAGRMLVFKPKSEIVVEAAERSRVMLAGGEPLGPRFLWWNFVSSSKERLEQAKRDWKDGRFPKVPGDEKEWIPLPEA